MSQAIVRSGEVLTRSAPRAKRVLIAVRIIWVLSILDLLLTVTLMTTSGMVESNPIARVIAQMGGGTYPLMAWKVLCTALATMILVNLRGRWTSEAGAWACVAALVLTMGMWVGYLQCDDIRLLSSQSLNQSIDGWVLVQR